MGKKEEKVALEVVEADEDFVREHSIKEATRGVPVSVKRLSPFVSWSLKIPFLGKKILEKKIKDGYIVAEIIMPNQTSMFYLIDTRFNAFTHRVSDKKEKLFIISPIKEEPERYVRYLNRIPVVTFNWKTGLPVPLEEQEGIPFDEDYWNDIVMRARLIGGSEKLIDWLNNTLKYLQLGIALSAGTLIFLVLQWMKLI